MLVAARPSVVADVSGVSPSHRGGSTNALLSRRLRSERRSNDESVRRSTAFSQRRTMFRLAARLQDEFDITTGLWVGLTRCARRVRAQARDAHLARRVLGQRGDLRRAPVVGRRRRGGWGRARSLLAAHVRAPDALLIGRGRGLGHLIARARGRRRRRARGRRCCRYDRRRIGGGCGWISGRVRTRTPQNERAQKQEREARRQRRTS